MLVKIKEAITNGEFRNTGNIGHKTRNKHKQNKKHSAENLNDSNMDPTKNHLLWKGK